MRRLRMAVVLAATLALLAGSAAAALAGPANRDSVVGGGLRIAPDGTPNRSFSVSARALAGGGASGSYTFLVLHSGSRNGPSDRFTGTVTCLDVVGNQAVIGGHITKGNIAPGGDFLVFLIDGGAPVGGQPGPDMVSLTYITPQDDWPSGDIPGDFHTHCPSANGPSYDTVGIRGEWRSVQGNIVVKDAP